MAKSIARLQKVKQSLLKVYGKTHPPVQNVTVLERLLSAIFGGSVNSARGRKICKQFEAAFVDINEIRVSRVRELARNMQDVNNPIKVADTILKVLGKIFVDRGSVELEFIKDMGGEEARKYLMSLAGISEFLATELMLIALADKVFPVNAEIMRVVKRIGLVQTQTNRIQVQKKMQDIMSPHDFYQMFYALYSHAASKCFEENPRCSECVLAKQCKAFAEFQKMKAAKKKTVVKETAKQKKQAKTTVSKSKQKPKAKAKPKTVKAKSKPKQLKKKTSAKTPARPKPKAKIKPKPKPKTKAKPKPKMKAKAKAKPKPKPKSKKSRR